MRTVVRNKSRILLFTLLLAVFAFATAGSAQLVQGPRLDRSPIHGASSKAKQTSQTNQPLHFNASGHALSFYKQAVYVGAGDHVLKVEFVGSEDVSPTSNSDLFASGRVHKTTDLNTVSYQNIWDSISLKYEGGTHGIAKSSYLLDAGASVDHIRLRYNVPARIDQTGELVFRFATGEMRESAPIAWQVVNGKRVSVAVNFRLLANREVGFAVGSYDRKLPLLIDPILQWNTFLGGDGNDFGLGIAADGSGNIYVVGQSNATWGSPIRSLPALSTAAFVAKLNSNGALQWNTFLGGTISSFGTAIAVDDVGNVYVTGQSTETWGTPLHPLTGGADAFVAKLNSDGALQWNTFYGSASTDQGSGIAVDGTGIYLSGYSEASWGTPVHPFTTSGLRDAFALKLTLNGALLWNTFLGGAQNDFGNAVAVDTNGSVFVTGESNAAWGLPVNAYTDRADAFVAKLDSNGTLQWNTFLGTASNDDVGYGIAADSDGNALVTGRENFVAKLNPSGVVQWNSAPGGREGRGVALDASGNVYVAAHNELDAITTKFDSFGVLQWSAFNGSGGTEFGTGIAFVGPANIYEVGHGNMSWGTPIRAYTPGQNQNANFDAFVFKLQDLPPPTVQFNSSIYPISEGPPPNGTTARVASILVTRSGDTSTTVTVDYATSDGTGPTPASQRTDYTTASGTLTFAPGQTTRTFNIPIIDDLYVEQTETVNLTLSNPVGANLGSLSQAVLSIDDDEEEPGTTNPLDDPSFFVRQHYFDFLSRSPDANGFNFWVNQISGANCGSNAACLLQRRITVSNAFFFELEFQQTGAYVFRLYRAAYGNNQPFPNPRPDPNFPNEEKKLPSYQVFSRDRAKVIGGLNLAQKQLDLANLFVLRAEFLAKYPASLVTGAQFVDAVLGTIQTDLGVNLSSQRDALITLYNGGGRAAVMYRLADDNVQTNPINNRALIDAEYNRAFVTTQYFGYLRRNPDIPGIIFWLSQVNSAPLRDLGKQNAMVCSFITSGEYQFRFSPVAPHSNTECPQ